MTKRILWLDNDVAYLDSYFHALSDEGYLVNPAATVGEAEHLLSRDNFDLVIIDAMVPTKTEDEEVQYRPEETDHGYKTGLIFYIRNKKRFEETNIPVLVMTVRLDKAILDQFEKAGLRRESFTTKLAMRDIQIFLSRVERIMAR